MIRAAAYEPSDVGILKSWINRDGTERSGLERNVVRSATTRNSFPDFLGLAGFGCQVFAGDSVIPTELRSDLQRLGIQIDTERHADRRGKDGLRLRSRKFSRPIVSTGAASTDAFDGQFITGRIVTFLRVVTFVDFNYGCGSTIVLIDTFITRLRCEDSDEVAVTDAFIDLFLIPTDRAEQFLDRHCLQHLTHCERRRDSFFQFLLFIAHAELLSIGRCRVCLIGAVRFVRVFPLENTFLNHRSQKAVSQSCRTSIHQLSKLECSEVTPLT